MADQPPPNQNDPDSDPTDANAAAVDDDNESSPNVAVPDLNQAAEVGPSSSSSSSSTTTTTATTIPAAVEGSHRIKRSRRFVSSVQPSCSICHATFASWPALFGHLNSHNTRKERGWKGAFPPPSFVGDWVKRSPDGSWEAAVVENRQEVNVEQIIEKEIVPALMDIASQKMRRDEERSSSKVGDSETISPPTKKIELDLNRSPPKDDDDDDDDDEDEDI